MLWRFNVIKYIMVPIFIRGPSGEASGREPSKKKEEPFVMKKTLALLLLALLLLTACSAPAGKGEADNKLVVGLDDSFPPMGFRDDDSNLVGFDIDLAKALGEELGLEVEFKPIDWDAKVMELDAGNIDCIWNGLSISPEREEEMDFTRPYLANEQLIIVLSDSTVSGIADLEGLTVGLQRGSTALDAFNKNEISGKVAGLNEYADNVAALTDLSIGRIDAVVMDEVVARYYETKDAGAYKVLDESFAAEQYAIGIKKGNTELKETIQAGFDQLIENGKAAEISEKWFGKDIVLKP